MVKPGLKAIRSEVTEEVQKWLRSELHVPGLAVVLVGENPASRVYVRNKCRACEEVGITSIRHDLPEHISEEELLSR